MDNTYMMAPAATSADPARMTRIQAVHGQDVRVSRNIYSVRVLRIYGTETVVLVGRGDADPAYSGTDRTDYGYTHGGKTYRLACDVADDIERWIGGDEIDGAIYTDAAKKFLMARSGCDA